MNHKRSICRLNDCYRTSFTGAMLAIVAALTLSATLISCSKSEAPKGEASSAGPGAAPSAKGSVNPVFASKVCGVLTKVLPQAAARPPIDALTTLIQELGNAFSANPVELTENIDQLDAAAMASCPKEREAFLTVLGKGSLLDALMNPEDPAKAAQGEQKK